MQRAVSYLALCKHCTHVILAIQNVSKQVVAFSCFAVLRQDHDVKAKGEISVTGTNPLPSKHDVICSLAVAGRWVTSLQDLQVSSVLGKCFNRQV